MKSTYVLKATPETITADPEVLHRLERFLAWQLSIDGEMYKALQKETKLGGKHGSVAESGSE